MYVYQYLYSCTFRLEFTVRLRQAQRFHDLVAKVVSRSTFPSTLPGCIMSKPSNTLHTTSQSYSRRFSVCGAVFVALPYTSELYLDILHKVKTCKKNSDTIFTEYFDTEYGGHVRPKSRVLPVLKVVSGVCTLTKHILCSFHSFQKSAQQTSVRTCLDVFGMSGVLTSPQKIVTAMQFSLLHYKLKQHPLSCCQVFVSMPGAFLVVSVIRVDYIHCDLQHQLVSALAVKRCHPLNVNTRKMPVKIQGRIIYFVFLLFSPLLLYSFIPSIPFPSLPSRFPVVPTFL